MVAPGTGRRGGPGPAVRALTAEQAIVIAPMFKALGDPVRLRLMSMIVSRPEAVRRLGAQLECVPAPAT